MLFLSYSWKKVDLNWRMPTFLSTKTGEPCDFIEGQIDCFAFI